MKSFFIHLLSIFRSKQSTMWYYFWIINVFTMFTFLLFYLYDNNYVLVIDKVTGFLKSSWTNEQAKFILDIKFALKLIAFWELIVTLVISFIIIGFFNFRRGSKWNFGRRFYNLYYLLNIWIYILISLVNSILLLNVYIFTNILYYCFSAKSFFLSTWIIVFLLFIYLNLFLVKYKTITTNYSYYDSHGVLFGNFDVEWDFICYCRFDSKFKEYYFFSFGLWLISVFYRLIDENYEYDISFNDISIASIYFVPYPRGWKKIFKLISVLFLSTLVLFSLMFILYMCGFVYIHNALYRLVKCTQRGCRMYWRWHASDKNIMLTLDNKDNTLIRDPDKEDFFASRITPCKFLKFKDVTREGLISSLSRQFSLISEDQITTKTECLNEINKN